MAVALAPIERGRGRGAPPLAARSAAPRSGRAAGRRSTSRPPPREPSPRSRASPLARPEIAELEINPLLVTAGRRRSALDARIVLGDARKEPTMLAEGTFEGKVAIVTGGGGGLGRAMALEFARLGAAVVVAGRRPEPLEETVARDRGLGRRRPIRSRPTSATRSRSTRSMATRPRAVSAAWTSSSTTRPATSSFAARISRRTAGGRSSASSSTAASCARAPPGDG